MRRISSIELYIEIVKGQDLLQYQSKILAVAIMKNVNFIRFSVSTNLDVCASPLYKFVIQKESTKKFAKQQIEETEKSNSNWMNIFFKTIYPALHPKKLISMIRST